MSQKIVYQGPDEGLYSFGSFYQFMNTRCLNLISKNINPKTERILMRWGVSQGVKIVFQYRDGHVEVRLEGDSDKFGEVEKIILLEEKRRKENPVETN